MTRKEIEAERLEKEKLMKVFETNLSPDRNVLLPVENPYYEMNRAVLQIKGMPQPRPRPRPYKPNSCHIIIFS